MATLCQFPSLSLLSSRKHFLLDQHKIQQPEIGLCPQQQRSPPQKFCRFRVSSIKKSSRKVKSNEELTDEIREFIAAVGLPEDHVPSMKEFSQHGRNDLANIVRRRGYKLVRELLENSTRVNEHGSTTGKIITENTYAICELTGQDVVANDVAGEFLLSTKVSTRDNHSGGLLKDPGLDMGDNINLSMEPLFDSSPEEKASLELNDHNEKADNMVEDVSLSTKVPSLENCSTASNAGLAFVAGNPSGNISSNSSLQAENPSDLNGGNKIVNNTVEDTLLPTRVPVEEKYFHGLNNDETMISDYQGQISTESSSGSSFEGNVVCQSQEVNNALEDVTSLDEILIAENHLSSSNAEPSRSANDHISVDVDSSSHLSLEEKVANFMQNGDLDTIEDDANAIKCKSGTEEGKGYIELQDAKEVHSRTSSEHSETILNGDNTAMVSNGSTSESMDSNLTTEGPGTQFEKDQDFEPRNSENQVEISELKSMLHQKELELSRLREEIEKEKLALSALQAKAEVKINKARKLISDKDAELQAAEDTLSGLVEDLSSKKTIGSVRKSEGLYYFETTNTHIQYYGDGDIVEMAGSFNGWQQWIKMEPPPSYSLSETSGYRKSRLWSTVIWLYPGVYEIKFIVDGHWKIDPQRETITHGTICNNILRVDR